jgi:hypothetical protein
VCTVITEEDDQELSIQSDYLEPVIPVINDQVKIICGDDRGLIGTLANIDGREGIVSFDDGSVRMVLLKLLCRYQS